MRSTCGNCDMMIGMIYFYQLLSNCFKTILQILFPLLVGRSILYYQFFVSNVYVGVIIREKIVTYMMNSTFDSILDGESIFNRRHHVHHVPRKNRTVSPEASSYDFDLVDDLSVLQFDGVVCV